MVARGAGASLVEPPRSALARSAPPGTAATAAPSLRLPIDPTSTGRAAMVASVATAMRTRSVASTLRVAPWFTQAGDAAGDGRRPLRPSKLGLRQVERNPGVAQRG